MSVLSWSESMSFNFFRAKIIYMVWFCMNPCGSILIFKEKKSRQKYRKTKNFSFHSMYSRMNFK